MKMKECEMASKVVTHLAESGFDVYQEVMGQYGVCDIVGVFDKITVAVECKTSFSLAVLGQAYRWRYSAHYVYVAVPARSAPDEFGQKICRDYGIGRLTCGQEIRESIRPHLFRAKMKKTGFKLYEQQKTFCAAGSANGGHWTPFKQTVSNVISLVRQKPGIPFTDLIKEIDYHYRTPGTAKSCLRKFIDTDVIPGVETRMVDRKLCVFPKGL
jgi:hypothetical protein